MAGFCWGERLRRVDKSGLALIFLGLQSGKKVAAPAPLLPPSARGQHHKWWVRSEAGYSSQQLQRSILRDIYQPAKDGEYGEATIHLTRGKTSKLADLGSVRLA